jgi:hypothetical protein
MLNFCFGIENPQLVFQYKRGKGFFKKKKCVCFKILYSIQSMKKCIQKEKKKEKSNDYINIATSTKLDN